MAGDQGKFGKIVTGAGAIGLAIKAEVDVEHQEVKRVDVFGMPLFRRTRDEGLPVILGIKFPRWIRGPRGG